MNFTYYICFAYPLQQKGLLQIQIKIMALRYQNEICHLASMHQKERALALPFEKILGCRVIPASINTDQFGTFSGEIERTLTPSACAKEKCYKALTSENGTLGVASEGSFGAHPVNPFIPTDFEILFFADRKLGLELSLSKISIETNFLAKSVKNIEELSAFAQKALFPSHALILRPEGNQDPSLIFKGVQNFEELFSIFQRCSEISKYGLVWIETDMRAHMNPTRMKVIENLAYEIATRLVMTCPHCQIPGWGVVKNIPGLPCRECLSPTYLIKTEIFGCCKCEHLQVVDKENEMADSCHCSFCNP